MGTPFDGVGEATLMAGVEPSGLATTYTGDQLHQMARYTTDQIENPGTSLLLIGTWERALDNIIDAMDLQKRAAA